MAADDARLVWDFSKQIDELKESRWCLKTGDRRTDASWRQEGRGRRQRELVFIKHTHAHTHAPSSLSLRRHLQGATCGPAAAVASLACAS